MNLFLLLALALSVCCVGAALIAHIRRAGRCRRRRMSRIVPPASAGLLQPKPDWCRRAVLQLHEQTGLSHRKLAAAFNQRYLAKTGISVGRTWVRELLKKQAYEVLHRHKALKHCIPVAEPRNRMWGIDTTCVADADGNTQIVLGIVDHGSRVNLALRCVRRFNTWTLLGTLLLAFGEYGVPHLLKLDNHPVHHAGRFKLVMRWAGVRLCYTQPASPWQNGRIERLFGTFKACLQGYLIRDAQHLARALAEFQFWYNTVRPHQHLGGRTPAQTWHGIDPYRTVPKRGRWFEAWEGRLRGWVLRH